MNLEAGQTKGLGVMDSPFEAQLNSNLPQVNVLVIGLDDHFETAAQPYRVGSGARSPDSAVTLLSQGGTTRLQVRPELLPANITRLLIACTPGTLHGHKLQLSLNGDTFDALQTQPQGRCVLVAQIYRQGTEWFLHAIGRGFAGDFNDLTNSFNPHVDRQTQRGQVARESVKLLRNESVNLSQLVDTPLTKLSFALGWEPLPGGEAVDLDASCLAFNDAKKVVDKVWFFHLQGCRGAVQHSGDNLTGAGTGDLETVSVDLTALPADVRWLVFTVNSFSLQKFTLIQQAYCRVKNLADDRELAHYELQNAGNVTGVIMAKLERTPEGWQFTALGVPGGGMTVRALVRPARDAL